MKHFLDGKYQQMVSKNIEDLPENAKNYIYAVEDFVKAKISSISTSPKGKIQY